MGVGSPMESEGRQERGCLASILLFLLGLGVVWLGNLSPLLSSSVRKALQSVFISRAMFTSLDGIMTVF